MSVSVAGNWTDYGARSSPCAGRDSKKIHVIISESEIAEDRFRREPLLNDFTAATGPFGMIGDVHGCLGDRSSLLDTLATPLSGASRGRVAPDGMQGHICW